MKRIGIVLSSVLVYTFLFFVGVLYAVKKFVPIIIEKEKNLEKSQKLFSVLVAWLNKKQQGKSIAAFFEKNDYHLIAIYGLGNVGKLVEKELEGNIKIRYGIDRREVSAEFPVYKPEDDLPGVDIVIVTAVYEFEEIEEMLKKKLSCPIYSVEDVIYFMD